MLRTVATCQTWFLPVGVDVWEAFSRLVICRQLSNSRRSLEKRIRPYQRLILTACRPSMTSVRDAFFIMRNAECLWIGGIRCDQDTVAPTRQDVGSRITGRHLGKAMLRRNPRQRSELTSSSRKTGLRTGDASTPGHKHRIALSSSPTADVCSRVAPTPLGTAGSTTVGPDRLKTPTSSGWQRPPRDVDSHAQNCARSDSLGFSVC